MTEPAHNPQVHRFSQRIPVGDDRERMVCDDCGWVHYVNPKVVVGSVVSWNDEILLCRRAIEPRVGYWTIPAGYLEEGETPDAGALREAWEEARAEIQIDALLAVYSIAVLSQVQLIYRGRLTSSQIQPGPESLEVGLFAWSNIPWNELAFPTVAWALDHYRRVMGLRDFQPFSQSTHPDGKVRLIGPSLPSPLAQPVISEAQDRLTRDPHQADERPCSQIDPQPTSADDRA
jgi:ADP-ribose pyrophosphatase YjhB (NUDIX family)